MSNISLQCRAWFGAAILLLAITAMAQQPTETAPPAAASASSAPAGAVDDSATPPKSTIKKLGTADPLDVFSHGPHVGPIYVTNVSLSGFNQQLFQGGGSVNRWGSTMTSDVVFSHAMHHGQIAAQYRPQISYVDGQVFRELLNQNAGVDFDFPLNARWSLAFGGHFTYYRNSSLTNPQSLFGSPISGDIVQNSFAQQRNSAMSESNNISLRYSYSARTEISISPTIAADFIRNDGHWDFVRQLGGGVSVSHLFTPTRRVSAFYNLSQATPSSRLQRIGSTLYQTAGLGFQDSVGKLFTVNASLGATRQSSSDTAHWVPTGTLGLMKSFRRSSITAAYSRTNAEKTLYSRGFVDQANLAFDYRLSRRASVSASAGEYRSALTSSHYRGRMAGGSLSYQFLAGLSADLGYTYLHQKGEDASLFVGRNKLFSLGLRYTFGQSAVH